MPQPLYDAMDCLRLRDWVAQRSTGELSGPLGVERLEPRVMDLLFMLGERPGEVVSRDEILARLWPEVVVTEDALARTVFKLRKALGDDAKAPRYIETLPKRGYRLVAAEAGPPLAPGAPRSVANGHYRRAWFLTLATVVLAGLLWLALRGGSALAEATTLTGRANDYYFQYTHSDNEAAIELFQRVITRHPDYAPAHAGLANALVQRVVRWPGAPDQIRGTFNRLGDALRQGITRTAEAKRELAHAELAARLAVALAPRDPAAHKALGFVRSAQEDFPGALEAYQTSVSLDPDAWGPLINIGELLELSGQPLAGLTSFEAAFAAMTRQYEREAVRIRPWYAPIAQLIGDRHRDAGRLDAAEIWYRKVLEISPLHREATAQLVELLKRTGRGEEAAVLRLHLEQKLGKH